MGPASGLSRRLRVALRQEEPRAVEELLRRGADPNLVLDDGAAAVHLAARARRPRSLRCLETLLRQGGDPNARSADGLTPLHVAAAWGCRRSLELLLRLRADPELRDQVVLCGQLLRGAPEGGREEEGEGLGCPQLTVLRQDGLRPLDLAEQQGHQDCVRVLRELEGLTWTEAEIQEPQQGPGEPRPWHEGLEDSPSGPPHVTLESTALGRGDSRDMGLEAAREPQCLLAHPEVADEDGRLLSPGCWDYSSDASFVTAVEASGTEHLAPCIFPWARSLPQTRQGLLSEPGSLGTQQLSHGAIMGGREAELNACLQPLTLTSPDASPSSTTLREQSPVPTPPRELLPEPCNPHSLEEDQPSLSSAVAEPCNPHSLEEDQPSLNSAVAALWLTEDEASSPGGKDPSPSRCCLPVPTMSDLELLQRLRAFGQNPGPVTPFTRRYYLQRLEELQVAPGLNFSGHSPELAEALRTGQIPNAQADEDVLAQQFEQPDPTRRWREGVVKSSFTYLLLDPRKTRDLPGQASSLTPLERLQTFVRAIFYVGKGTRARPNVHLWEALSHRGQPGKQACPKVRQILDIWASGHGVVSLHCFQHVVAAEAYTREACLVDALGIQMLTNQKQGHCYGVVAGWSRARRRRLGVHLLHRALLVFLAEGERELRPQDIQARG